MGAAILELLKAILNSCEVVLARLLVRLTVLAGLCEYAYCDHPSRSSPPSLTLFLMH